MILHRYKAIVRGSPGWRDHDAATLGVSTASPNWQGRKFAAILDLAAAHFRTIRIDVTDALYRHSFMAEGCPPEEALARANAMGALWLAEHRDIIEACRVKPQVIRWAAWYDEPDFAGMLADFERAHLLNPMLRDAVAADVADFYRRKDRAPTLREAECSRNYLIEELAVITMQARALASVKLYPGDELECLRVVRRGLVTEAPPGLEREQFAKVKLETRTPGTVPRAAAAYG